MSAAPRAQTRGPSGRSRRRAEAVESASAIGRPPRIGGRGGARLAAAFEAVESFPVLAEARRRVLRLARRSNVSAAQLAPVVEADIGLTVVVLRAANAHGTGRGIGSVPAALDILGPAAMARALKAAPAYDFLDADGPWGAVPEPMRRHAVAARVAAERIAEVAHLPGRDELATGALLHDMGRLVLLCLYDGYEEGLARGATPDERVRQERRELGVDHALVGGVLARRIGVSDRVATAIERHHAADSTGAEAAISLADLIAHHVHGDPVPAELLRARASALGLSPAALRDLLFEFPYRVGERPVVTEPCPLSARELDALRGLAEGRVYKEIAAEMGLSASTVRTHLHNVYRKLDTPDRAQAVLLARERGWV